MKPVKVFLFLLSVLALLLVLALWFPEDGLRLGKLRLNFISKNQLPGFSSLQYADISDIIKNSTASDSLHMDSLAKRHDSMLVDMKAVMAVKRHLEFPADNHQILASFFKTLVDLKSKKEHIRVIHYGDSQIEGDRITGFLRTRLQKLFGGGGPGMLAVKDVTRNYALDKEASPNWQRFTLFGKPDARIKHHRYGPMISFCRYSMHDDEPMPRDTSKRNAWFRISKLSKSNVGNFNVLRLLYSNNSRPITTYLSLSKDGPELKDTLPATEDIGIREWELKEVPSDIALSFRGGASPDVFGMTVDDQTGISVDNVPLRGSSGLEFTKSDLPFLGKIYQLMNVKLLILEFGVNVVPNVVKDYAFYETAFAKQLKALKETDPELSIIVIGLSDMARKKGGEFVSYENIEKIRDAQKNAAFKTGCAFWDMFEAMGGRNSMPSWVSADPSLAEKDYTHFNARGAGVIAEMFYNAVVEEYYHYLKDNKIPYIQ